jgi:hypothetical protein
MTTSAPNQGYTPLGSADPRRVRAWRIYRESIRDLDGEEYETAEARAWDRLQRMLAELERAARGDVRA